MKDQINTLLRKVGLKAEEIKLEQVTIDEGAATLEAEVFEAGQPVFIVNEDERIPVPVGEYKLDNGFVLVVTEEGMIADYKEFVEEAPAEEPMAEEAAMTEKPEETPLPKSIIESVVKETKFSAEEIEALKTELKAEILAELTKEEAPVELAEEPKKIQHNPEKVTEVTRIKIGNTGNSPIDRAMRIINQ